MKSHLNKKGFTLVELLAVIVILGLITGISVVAVFTSINNAKKKAEGEFLTQIGNAVEAYIELCSSGMSDDDPGEGCNKVINELVAAEDPATSNPYKIDKSHRKNVKVYLAKSYYGFTDIINKGIISRKNLVNPINYKDCNIGAGKNDIYIRFFRDEDYVYYYKIHLPESCIEYNEDNLNVIHNFPVGINDKLKDLLETDLYVSNNNDDANPAGGKQTDDFDVDENGGFDNQEENTGETPGGKTKNSLSENNDGKVTGSKVDEGGAFTLEESGGSIGEGEIVVSDGKVTDASKGTQ